MHRHMRHIYFKPMRLSKASHESRRDGSVNLVDPAAASAHQMQMVAVVGSVIGRWSVSEVRVRYEPELFQQVKRPVDRGDVDGGRGAFDLCRDLVGS